MLETKRLTVRAFALEDAAFILSLLNQPSFIENIADKGVRTLDDAKRYLKQGPLASYGQYGFGLWRLGLRDNDVAIGMAGFLKREGWDEVDLGYSLLSEYCGKGYAYEVVAALMSYARDHPGLGKVIAIVNQNNQPSIRLLTKLGFQYERQLCLVDGQTEVQVFTSVAN